MDKETKSVFENISQRMLVGGVAPRRVRGIVSELRDHYEDLHSAASENGASPQEARRESLSRLGNEDDLVNATLSRPELRSWSSRCPWFVYGLAPSVTVFLLAIFLSIITILPIELNSDILDNPIDVSPFTMSLAVIFVELSFLLVEYLLPLALAFWICYQTTLRKDRQLWPILGLTALCLVGASYHAQVSWPIETIQGGHISISSSLLPPFHFDLPHIYKALINLVFVAFCMVWCRANVRFHARDDFQQGES